jgi:hypothetical protein
MASSFSMLQIINAALVAQGQYPIDTNDGSDEWELLSRNWPLIVEAELEDGAYQFSKQQFSLLTRIDGKFGYDDGYTLPLTILHVRELWTEDTAGVRDYIDWTQDGAAVYVDHDSGVFVEGVIVAQEDLWSANFSRGVQMKLEALILRALKEEETSAARMEMQAEVHFERARTISSKSRSATSPFMRGQIATARFRRG